MRHKKLRFGQGFKVVVSNARSQAAQMTLASGETEGGPRNRHRGADQWLFVVHGQGVAVINDKSYRLEPGALVLIERGDRHELRNTGTGVLKTLNIYVPPAYSQQGHELPRGKE